MGFRAIQCHVAAPLKATRFLRQCGYNTKETQKILDKGRMRQNDKIIRKGDILAEGIVEIMGFVPDDIGVRPFFVRLPANHAFLQREDSQQEALSQRIHAQKIHGIQIEIAPKPPYFCVFNKPAKLLTHPKNLAQRQSLLDSARHYFGAHCNPCHRLDYETSGLLVCSLDKESEVLLKNCFLNREVRKSYLAIVEGICADSLFIESNIVFAKDFGNLCIQGKSADTQIHKVTKEEAQDIAENWEDRGRAATLLTPLRHFHDNAALIEYLTKTDNPFFPNRSLRESFYESYNEIQADSKLMWQYRAFVGSLFHTTQNDNSRFIFSNPPYNQQNNLIPQGQYTLLQLMPLSGKTHQLRIHTSSLNHRILGDTLYGLHPVVASFFLDSQSPKLKRTICEYRASFGVNLYHNCGTLSGSCLQDLQSYLPHCSKQDSQSLTYLGGTQGLECNTDSQSLTYLGGMRDLERTRDSQFHHRTPNPVPAQKSNRDLQSNVILSEAKYPFSQDNKISLRYYKQDSSLATQIQNDKVLQPLTYLSGTQGLECNTDSQPLTYLGGMRDLERTRDSQLHYRTLNPAPAQKSNRDSQSHIPHESSQDSQPNHSLKKYESNQCYTHQNIASLMPIHSTRNLTQQMLLRYWRLYNHCTMIHKSGKHRATTPPHCSMIHKSEIITPPHRFVSIVVSAIAIPCFFSHEAYNNALRHFPFWDTHWGFYSVLHESQSYTPQDNATSLITPTQNRAFEDIFFTFLYFFYALPQQQEEIIYTMRLYYCKAERLLLHANTLEFLNIHFHSP